MTYPASPRLKIPWSRIPFGCTSALLLFVAWAINPNLPFGRTSSRESPSPRNLGLAGTRPSESTPPSTNHVVTIQVTDRARRQKIPCRIHLKDPAGHPVIADGFPNWRGHFVCGGEAHVRLGTGVYAYEIDRGPEYFLAKGFFNSATNPILRVGLTRFTDLAAEGWWSGDLHVHRPLKDIELLMQAEDLHVAPVTTWWNNQNQWATSTPPARLLVQFDQNRFYHVMAGEDEREGGALLFFQLQQPLPLVGSSREYPSPMKFAAQARQTSGAWIDIEKPFWWDVPVWLASGQADSIGLANNHMCRDQMYESEAWGKPRDTNRLAAPRGNGFWSQEIYYRILNSGLRLPPSAGSASGVLPNPVGYNRVYVHLEQGFGYDQWWEGLRAGRSFVSNGPLLRCRVNGQFPGHVFTPPEGAPLKLKIDVTLSSRDPLQSIEIIRNGILERTVPHQGENQNRTIGELEFTESGWFLVRVIADHPKTFRFASTAPYYVEIGNSKRRVSRSAAQFFLDWTRERMARVKLNDPDQKHEVLREHEKAEAFWQDLVSKANAD